MRSLIIGSGTVGPGARRKRGLRLPTGCPSQLFGWLKLYKGFRRARAGTLIRSPRSLSMRKHSSSRGTRSSRRSAKHTSRTKRRSWQTARFQGQKRQLATRGSSSRVNELGRWLEPFLARLGHKARRRMCPLYVSGLIGPGDSRASALTNKLSVESVGTPMERSALGTPMEGRLEGRRAVVGGGVCRALGLDDAADHRGQVHRRPTLAVEQARLP
jgi:hypothetical protein